MFALLMVAALSINISQLKVPALFAQVSATLHAEPEQTALLTSIFNIAGVVLAIPGVALMARVGLKRMLMLLLVALTAGNILGAVAPGFEVMMLSRIIEGLSCTLILPVGLTFIAQLFNREQASIATGCFMVATPGANFIVMNAAPAITEATGTMRAVWWGLAAIAVVCLVLVALFLTVGDSATTDGAAERSEPAFALRAFQNPALICACLAMVFLSFVVQGLVTCYAQIFVSFGIEPGTANFYSSLNGLFGIPIGLVSGAIVAKSGRPYVCAIVGGVGAGLVCAALAHVPSAVYVACILGTAFFAGGIGVTAMFVIAPRLAERPAYVGQASGLLSACFYLGALLCTPVLVSLAGDGASSWELPTLALALSCALMVVLVVASWRLGGVRRLMERAA